MRPSGSRISKPAAAGGGGRRGGQSSIVSPAGSVVATEAPDGDEQPATKTSTAIHAPHDDLRLQLAAMVIGRYADSGGSGRRLTTACQRGDKRPPRPVCGNVTRSQPNLCHASPSADIEWARHSLSLASDLAVAPETIIECIEAARSNISNSHRCSASFS